MSNLDPKKVWSYNERVWACARIAELEGEIDQLTAHSDIERQDDKMKPCPFCGNEPVVEGNLVACNNLNCPTYDNYWTDPMIFTCDQWNNRPIEDALQARIAECESALISMVQQFFYNKDGEDGFRHAFMSAEEEAADYLVEHGIARWADKRKSSIYFNEVQE